MIGNRLGPRGLAALVTLTMAIGAAIGQAGAAEPLREGDAGPDFGVGDRDGKLLRLSALRGGPVVLVFDRAHW